VLGGSLLMRRKLLSIFAALAACVAGKPLPAANLLTNGGFEMVSLDHSSIINGDNPFQTVTGWSTTGYNFVMIDNPGYPIGPNTQTGADDYFNGAYTTPDNRDYATTNGHGGGNFTLWGPDTFGTPANNGLTNSPTGGNFIAADGSYHPAPIVQTLTGLVAGKQYTLSFWWAAAQQQGPTFNGVTQEGWVVCLGTCAYSPPSNDGGATIADEGIAYYNADPLAYGYNPADTSQIFKTSIVTTTNHGFVPWQYQTFTFTANADTQSLSLLAYGTPVGQPPFALIDGLSLDAVPEPTTWGMMLIGFGVVGGVMRTRRRPVSGRRALKAQII